MVESTLEVHKEREEYRQSLIAEETNFKNLIYSAKPKD